MRRDIDRIKESLSSLMITGPDGDKVQTAKSQLALHGQMITIEKACDHILPAVRSSLEEEVGCDEKVDFDSSVIFGTGKKLPLRAYYSHEELQAALHKVVGRM